MELKKVKKKQKSTNRRLWER